MTQNEVLVEPGDMADLPDERIDDVEPRPNKLLWRQPGDERKGPAAAVPQHLDEVGGRKGRSHERFAASQGGMKISLITPAPKPSRAGNQVTAGRWARLLRELGHEVRVARDYRDEP